jgi:hypothetical protein
MVESQAAVAEVQQRIGELVEVLQRLADQPQTIADLDAALNARHLDQFRAAMEVGGIRPPGDKCDPYVTALIVVLKRRGLSAAASGRRRPCSRRRASS